MNHLFSGLQIVEYKRLVCYCFAILHENHYYLKPPANFGRRILFTPSSRRSPMTSPIGSQPLFRTLVLAGALALSSLSGVASAADVNLYTTREPGLIQPLLEQFTKDSGIKVNTVFVKDGLIERVKA